MTFNKINLEFVLKISGCDKVESYLKQTNELIKITKKEVNAMKKINAKHDFTISRLVQERESGCLIPRLFMVLYLDFSVKMAETLRELDSA